MSFLAIPDFEVIQQGFADIGKKRAKNTFLLYKRKVSLAFAKLTFFAEREVSLAEGEAPCIFPSNALRTSTVSTCPYVVRFLICN